MMIKPGAAATDGALIKSAETDGFVAELMRDFQKITPDVGASVADLHFEAAVRAVNLPNGHRRNVGMMAIELAAAASCIAIILDTVGDLGGGRQQAAVEAFAVLLKQARGHQAQRRLDRVMGHG